MDDAKCLRTRSNRGSHSLYSILKDSWVISYKIKHPFAIRSSNHTPWYLPKETENLHPYKDLHLDVSSALRQSQRSTQGPEEGHSFTSR